MLAGRTILVTGARAPVALHLTRLFHAAGARVLLADSPAHPIAAASAFCAAYHRLPPPRFALEPYGDALMRVLQDNAVDLVVPTCEEVFYLGQLWRNRPMPARLFAPPMERLAEVHNKHAFIRLAERLGLGVPETRLLTTAGDVDAVRPQSRALVFKPVWSRFASDVLLRPSPAALKITPTAAAPWVAQAFLAGEEISAYAVAQSGTLRAVALYRGLYRAGRGAAVCFEPVSDANATEFVSTFVAGTGWTGQISFDLMRMPDGRVLPLECNPRATSGLHFFHDPAGFASVLADDGPLVRPDVTGPQGVRLALWLYGLPAALRSGALGRFRATLGKMGEVMDWPGDPSPRKAQLRALAEIAGLALRQRISLQRASTRDIEWNGPDQSAI